MGNHNMNGNAQYGYGDNAEDFFSDEFDVVYDANYDNQVDEYINLYLRDDGSDSGMPIIF